MAQALNTDDVTKPPGSNPPDTTNISNPTDTPTEGPSKFSQAASSIKESAISASAIVSGKSKERLSMEGQLRQARISLERYVNPKILGNQINEDTRIPKWVLKRAKGLVFLSVIKAGFLFAGNIGTGCVIIRQPNGGWTGPSSIGVGGISFGFLAGASKIDYIMILPDDKAVKQFTGKGQLRLGGEIQLAVGPVGREGSGSVGAGDKGVSILYSYSHAQGLYGGLALDGKVIGVRPDCNKTFYKQSIACTDILNGNIDSPPNEDYDMIIHLLDSYCLDDDMTPIQGEKLSIDDLNNVNNNNDDEKKEINNNDNNNNNNDNNNEPSMVEKVSLGFNKFTKSVSQKFLSLTSSDNNDNKKENVKLQQSDVKNEQVKNEQEKKRLMDNDNDNDNDNDKENVKGNANNYNTGNYEIGGDELIANINDEDDDDDDVNDQTK